MKTTHTFGVQFIIRVNKVKGDEATIYARVAVDDRKIEISLRPGLLPEFKEILNLGLH